MHQRESLTLYLLDHHAQYLLLDLLLFWKEHEARSVLSFLRHGDALQQDKLVGNLQHNSRTVASLVSGLSTAMLHVF